MVGRDLRKSRRINLSQKINIKLGSVGSDMKYQLTAKNISSVGFFLEFAEPHRFPFNSASLMEVWIDLTDKDQIFFNGKLARVVYPEDDLASISGAGIGIKIVQISPEHQQVLDDFIVAHAGEEDDDLRAKEEQKAS